MSYPYTDSGYNMYDMLSMLQKSIRRCNYEHAGFAANQLKRTYRSTMWNRLFVISAEDCFGVLTKELIALKKQDDRNKSDTVVSNAVALMCRSKKSRDACYFSCNFVLASRKPRAIPVTKESAEKIYRWIKRDEQNGNEEYDQSGFYQVSLFHEKSENDYIPDIPKEDRWKVYAVASLRIALKHRDMDMIGYEMDILRKEERALLWDTFIEYALTETMVEEEIKALREADDIVNKNKKDKDEIFISKAAILLCHCNDAIFETICSSEMVSLEHVINWTNIRVKSMDSCKLKTGNIPEWVYDCHTLKGKKMGKTDWDMTITEQAALTPLQPAYFDEASWLYTYEQDFENGIINEELMNTIRKFAINHPVNPVQWIPYEENF